MKEPVEKPQPGWLDELQTAATDTIATVKKLIAEGNARRLIIRGREDRHLLEIPLTAGVLIGSILVVLVPLLAAIGAVAALLVGMKFEIVRESRD